MCRNIRVLLNFEPPTTDDEVHAAAVQYVRKVSGTTKKPSKKNEAIFQRAVAEIAHITRHLLDDMETNTPPRTREQERAKGRARNEKRFGPASAAG